jgi:hypothetical protein
MAHTGRMPLVASPAAKRTACSSAMPTSKNWRGTSAASFERPVPLGIAAVMPTTRGSSLANRTMALPKTSW